MDRSYCVITPARDEAEFAARTIESVIAQTLRPERWIIVDDGSTDDTAEIVEFYARSHAWIELVRLPDRGERKVGPGVIEAFYAGYETIDPDEYRYLVKLDLDLDLPDTYFETAISRMEADPRAGTLSGRPYCPGPGGKLVPEMGSDEMSVGMIKLYRTACFQQIGGFVREVMWDGIDCHRARQLGWIASSTDDPALRFLHLRPMGSSHRGILTGRARHGYGQYFMGTSFPYLLASAAYRAFRAPFVLGSLAMLYGYVRAWCQGRTRYDNREFRRFLRRFHWEALLLGKARATRRAEARQKPHWSPPAEPEPTSTLSDGEASA